MQSGQIGFERNPKCFIEVHTVGCSWIREFSSSGRCLENAHDSGKELSPTAALFVFITSSLASEWREIKRPASEIQIDRVFSSLLSLSLRSCFHRSGRLIHCLLNDHLLLAAPPLSLRGYRHRGLAV